jgi:hypothetical protein
VRAMGSPLITILTTLWLQSDSDVDHEGTKLESL